MFDWVLFWWAIIIVILILKLFVLLWYCVRFKKQKRERQARQQQQMAQMRAQHMQQQQAFAGPPNPYFPSAYPQQQQHNLAFSIDSSNPQGPAVVSVTMVEDAKPPSYESVTQQRF